jgi:hypothetical protein
VKLEVREIRQREVPDINSLSMMDVTKELVKAVVKYKHIFTREEKWTLIKACIKILYVLTK